jgi:hypothetical protein
VRLELESGRTLEAVTEQDLDDSICQEEFAILSRNPSTYIQCAKHFDRAGQYILEYQDGSLQRHYRAGDPALGPDRVLAAFRSYLRGDDGWRSDFRWERVEL